MKGQIKVRTVLFEDITGGPSHIAAAPVTTLAYL